MDYKSIVLVIETNEMIKIRDELIIDFIKKMEEVLQRNFLKTPLYLLVALL